MIAKIAKKSQRNPSKTGYTNMRLTETQKENNNLFRLIFSPKMKSKLKNRSRKDKGNQKNLIHSIMRNKSGSPQINDRPAIEKIKLKKTCTNSLAHIGSFIKSGDKISKNTLSPLTKTEETTDSKLRLPSKSNFHIDKDKDKDKHKDKDKLDSKSQINLNPEMIPFFSTKFSTNRIYNHRIPETTKRNTITNLQTGLMNNILKVKSNNFSSESLLSMSNTYLNSLHEISLLADPELSLLLESIEIGIRKIHKILLKNVKKCECPNNIKIIEDLNKKITEEKIKNELKSNDKEIIEEKLRGTMCELKEFKKENERLKKIITEKEASRVSMFVQTENTQETKEIKHNIPEKNEEISMLKHRENKLIYFFNLLKERGYPIDKIYDSEVKDISTERFSEVSEVEHKKNSKNKLSFEEILKDVNNSKLSNLSNSGKQ